ncbi:hypothetical protein PAEPH01_2626, partial [Pancytospora epiphaga]
TIYSSSNARSSAHRSLPGQTTRSILEQWFKLGRLPSYPRGHDTVNLLLCKKISSLKLSSEVKTHEREKFRFKFTPKESPVDFVKELEILESMDQDVVTWISKFRNTVKICEWTETASLQILKNVVSWEIMEAVGEVKDTEDLLSKLVHLKYPREEGTTFQTEMSRVKQANYLLISEYRKAIEDAIAAASIACDWGKGETERRFEEQFMAGLGTATRMELDTQGLRRLKESYERLTAIEKNLLNQMRERAEEKGTNPKEEIENSKSQKWCSYHQTTSHSNSECLNQLRRKATTPVPVPVQPEVTSATETEGRKWKRRNKKKSSYLFKEPNAGQYSFKGSLNDLPLTWTLDSGASQNFLSEEIARKANLTITKPSKEHTVLFGDGRPGKILGTAEVLLAFDQLPGIKWKTKLQIIQSTITTGILGLEFLRAQDVKNYYKSGWLSIGELRMYEEKEGKPERAEPDTWLEERTSNMMVKLQSPNIIEQSKQLIEEVTRETPESGHISEVKMTIDLIETPQKKVR